MESARYSPRPLFFEDSFPEIFSKKQNPQPRSPQPLHFLKDGICFAPHAERAFIFFNHLSQKQTHALFCRDAGENAGFAKKKNTDKKSRSIFVFSTPPTSLHCNDIVLRGLQLRDVSGERMRQERLRNLFRTPPGQTTHKTRSLTASITPRETLWSMGGWNNPALMVKGRTNALQDGNRCCKQ